MKQKLTKLTKIGILLFAISISLTNCQQDDITSKLTKQEIGEEASFKSSKISFDKISQNELLTSRVQTLQKKLSKSNQQAQNKGEYNSTYDFMIDINHAKYIESIDGDYHSYTFPIYRNTESNLLENLLLSLQKDGTYRAFLVTYNLTEQQKEDLKSGKEVVGIEDQVEMTDLDNRFSSDCIAGYASHWTCAANNNHSPADVATGDCVQTSFTVSIEAVPGFCPPAGGTSSTNTDTNGEPGTQTNTSSGTNHDENPDGTDNTNVTEPTILSNAEKLELFIDLTPQQEFWANKQDDDVIQEIMTYMLINCGQDYNSSSCQEAEDYTMEIIDSGVGNTLISVFPFFQYPIGSNYSSIYPNLTVLLNEYMELLKTRENLINTIHNLTGVSPEDIIDDLTWDKGPIVEIQDLGYDNQGNEIKGKFNPMQNPNIIYIDIDLVNYLENQSNIENPTPEEQQQLGMLNGLIVYAVALHEYVHYADFAFDGTMQDNEDLELGELFEAEFVNGYYEFAPDGTIILIPTN